MFFQLCLLIALKSHYISPVSLLTMAINGACNRHCGRGGSTRRLHQKLCEIKSFRVFDGGEPGSTDVERRNFLLGMIPPKWVNFINANDNDALAVAA